MHIPPKGVYVGTWIQAVTKASSVLGQLCTEAILIQQLTRKPNLRSENKSRVAVISIAYFHVKKGGGGWFYTF